jgi:anti-sigma B factor antagonist
MSNEPVSGIRWNGKVAIVDASGEIDLHQSTVLQKKLLAVLDKKPDRMIINLANVSYMDSSGVASLVKLLSRTRKNGISLGLAAPTKKVKAIFEITRLDSVFNIFDTEEEALA